MFSELRNPKPESRISINAAMSSCVQALQWQLALHLFGDLLEAKALRSHQRLEFLRTTWRLMVLSNPIITLLTAQL